MPRGQIDACRCILVGVLSFFGSTDVGISIQVVVMEIALRTGRLIPPPRAQPHALDPRAHPACPPRA